MDDITGQPGLSHQSCTGAVNIMIIMRRESLALMGLGIIVACLMRYYSLGCQHEDHNRTLLCLSTHQYVTQSQALWEAASH